MKKIIFLATLVSTTLSFAQEDLRYETKSRTISETIVKLSKCSSVKVDSYDTLGSANVYNRETNAYEYRSDVPQTTLTGSATINMVKCRVVENYTVGVTGSMWKWNRKESEIPGSARRVTQLVSQERNVSDTKSIINIDLNDGLTGLGAAILIEQGMKSNVASLCRDELEKLNNLRANINDTECARQ